MLSTTTARYLNPNQDRLNKSRAGKPNLCSRYRPLHRDEETGKPPETSSRARRNTQQIPSKPRETEDSHRERSSHPHQPNSRHLFMDSGDVASLRPFSARIVYSIGDGARTWTASMIRDMTPSHLHYGGSTQEKICLRWLLSLPTIFFRDMSLVTHLL